MDQGKSEPRHCKTASVRRRKSALDIKDVLFHLDTGEAGQSVSDFAMSLAASTGAHLTAAGVAIHYPPLAADVGEFGAGWDLSTLEALSALTEHSRKAATHVYERLVKAAPVDLHMEFVMIETFPQLVGDCFGQLARRFDLSIVAQRAPGEGQDERDMIGGALFGSGRPVFIVPFGHKGAATLRKAMVCWDGGVQAARALAESLPLLAQAQSVEVVCVRHEDEAAERLPGFDVTRHLARHGIVSAFHELPSADDVGSMILSHAADSAVDLIVMGAYGHWRLRELVFGGATRTVLASTPIPTFMAH